MNDYGFSRIQRFVQLAQRPVFRRSIAHAQPSQGRLLIKDRLQAARSLCHRSTPLGRNHIRRYVRCPIVFQYHCNASILTRTRRVDPVAELMEVRHAFDIARTGGPAEEKDHEKRAQTALDWGHQSTPFHD